MRRYSTKISNMMKRSDHQRQHHKFIVHAVTTSLKTKTFIPREGLSSLLYGSHWWLVTWTDLHAFSGSPFHAVSCPCDPLSVSVPFGGPLTVSAPCGSPLIETDPCGGPLSVTALSCDPLSETVPFGPLTGTALSCDPLSEIAPSYEDGKVMGSFEILRSIFQE
uniref:Uncharacterized protein n=1 Tax=Arundo donax TaxID=35708 RepID=A0A0A9ECS6_ARUDO